MANPNFNCCRIISARATAGWFITSSTCLLSTAKTFGTIRCANENKCWNDLSKGRKNVLLSEHVEADGIAFFLAATEEGLEGIVAKKAPAPIGRCACNLDWLKIKALKRQEAVIGGFTRPKGGRQNFGALVLGVYQGKDLVYIGHSGSGLDAESLADVREEARTVATTGVSFQRATAHELARRVGETVSRVRG